MLKKIRHPKIFVLSFLLMYSLSAYQFNNDYSKFKTLRQKGVLIETYAEFVPKKFYTDYYKFTFTTLDGQTISESGKCGNRKRFDEFYSDLQIVYDPDNPTSYLEKPYFDNFSLGFKVFFYFGLYGIIGTIVNFGFLRTAYLLRNKEFRNQIKKTLHNTQL